MMQSPCFIEYPCGVSKVIIFDRLLHESMKFKIPIGFLASFGITKNFIFTGGIFYEKFGEFFAPILYQI